MPSTSESFRVTGMTCDHCVAAVTREISSLPGVSSVEISLSPGGISDVVVTSGAPLPRDEVRAAIDEAGYELVG